MHFKVPSQTILILWCGMQRGAWSFLLDNQACSFFGAGCKPKMKTWFGQYWLGLVRLLAQEEQAAPADLPRCPVLSWICLCLSQC